MASRQFFSSLLPWILVLSVLSLVSSREQLICGGSQCPECCPPGQRSAPGVGIDLTMEYAWLTSHNKNTAAIHFKNGTIWDLAKVDGSSEYRAAMQKITNDALNIRNGLDSSLERVHFEDPTWRNPYPLSKCWRWPWAWWYNLPVWKRQLLDRFYHYQPPNPLYFSDDWIHAISAMLSDIKSAALDPLNPPLGFNDVYLTWPDALYGTRQIHAPRFSLACHLAGLKSIKYAGDIVSKATLQLEGVDFFPEEVDPTAPTTILAVSYNAASLGIILYTTDVYGAESTQHDDSAKYWTEVQELIEDVIGDEVVDYVLLLGSHSDDSKPLNALKATVAHGLLPESGLQEDKDRLVFLGARAAAEIAQVGMEPNFEYCWQPAWCITDGEEPVRHVKSEL